VQLDDIDPPLKEAKTEEAATALGGGVKTVADQFSKNDALTDWAKGIGMSIWNAMDTRRQGSDDRHRRADVRARCRVDGG